MLWKREGLKGLVKAICVILKLYTAERSTVEHINKNPDGRNWNMQRIKMTHE